MAGLRVKGVALSVGIFSVVIHLIWVIILQVFGTDYLNWKLGLHFVSISGSVLPFNIVTFISLLIFSFIGGYIVGAIFAYIYNKFGK